MTGYRVIDRDHRHMDILAVGEPPGPVRRDRRTGLVVVVLLVVVVIGCCIAPSFWFVRDQQHRQAAEQAVAQAGQRVVDGLPLPSSWQRGPVTYRGCGWPAFLAHQVCQPDSWDMTAVPPSSLAAGQAFATLAAALSGAGWAPCFAPAPFRLAAACWRGGGYRLDASFTAVEPCATGQPSSCIRLATATGTGVQIDLSLGR